LTASTPSSQPSAAVPSSPEVPPVAQHQQVTAAPSTGRQLASPNADTQQSPLPNRSTAALPSHGAPQQVSSPFLGLPPQRGVDPALLDAMKTLGGNDSGGSSVPPTMASPSSSPSKKNSSGGFLSKLWGGGGKRDAPSAGAGSGSERKDQRPNGMKLVKKFEPGALESSMLGGFVPASQTPQATAGLALLAMRRAVTRAPFLGSRDGGFFSMKDEYADAKNVAEQVLHLVGGVASFLCLSASAAIAHLLSL